MENWCVPYKNDDISQIKHEIDRYVRYANIVNVVLFAKTSNGTCPRGTSVIGQRKLYTKRTNSTPTGSKQILFESLL